MCGIFGFIGEVSIKKTKDLYNLLEYLAWESESRGTHSTGFAARFSNGDLVSDKLPYRGSSFCQMSHKFKMLKHRMPSTFIGHTRYGTGSNPAINNNNHPFFGSNFHMVHNGTIPAWKTEAKKLNILDKMLSETDSEIILRTLEKRQAENNEPLKKSVEWILGNIWGNMAVALLDLNAPHVWLFRNENPINIFAIPAKFFGAPIWIFTSTYKIFADAWEGAFNTKAPLTYQGIESRYLIDNQLFRFSTEEEVVNNVSKTMLHYPINVTRRFYKQTSYCGDYSSRAYEHYKVTEPKKQFFSKVIDPTLPWLTPRFKPEEILEINKYISDDKKQKEILVDGMGCREFSRLTELVGEIIDASGHQRIRTVVKTGNKDKNFVGTI